MKVNLRRRGSYLQAVVTAVALLGTASVTGVVSADTVDNLLKEYQASGAGPFDANRGKQHWTKDYVSSEGDGMRNCTTCHTNNLRGSGKHAKTGKVIDPLAPSVNKERLTDPKFIEKWFKRNCTWVLNRECTPQEKGDFLVYLREQ